MAKYLRNLYKIAEKYLYEYKELKEEIENAKEDMILTRKNYIGELTNNGYYSNPVENAVINFEKKYEKKEKWCKVVEKALEIIKAENEHKYKLAVMRYLGKKQLFDILEELEIETATYYRWKDDIVNLVIMLAIQEQLIRVYEH